MSTSSRAPFYDLFKLIVAIILLLLFLFLIRISPGGTPEPISSILTSTPLPPTGTTIPATSTVVPVTPSPNTTSTPISPTNTPQPADTPTQIPTPTPPSETPIPETSPTPSIEVPSETEACTLSRPQLQVGMKAIIQRRLNFRSSPGIMDNWIITNVPGTQVEVVGGPVCTHYPNSVAYLWWQIKLPDGSVGWSAEASAVGTFYFMEPMK